jgi:hypothetical protein
MRYLRVLVKSKDGRQFFSRAVVISESRAVLRGEHVLPTGMLCDLQISFLRRMKLGLQLWPVCKPKWMK